MIWYQRSSAEKASPRALIPRTVRFILRYSCCSACCSFQPQHWRSSLVFCAASSGIASNLLWSRQLIVVIVVPRSRVRSSSRLSRTPQQGKKCNPIGLRMLGSGWPENWRYVLVAARVHWSDHGFVWLMPSGLIGWAIVGALGSLASWEPSRATTANPTRGWFRSIDPTSLEPQAPSGGRSLSRRLRLVQPLVRAGLRAGIDTDARTSAGREVQLLQRGRELRKSPKARA